MFMFRIGFIFNGVGLLATRQTLNLEDHPLSFVLDFLLNVFTVTLHNCMSCHAVVKGIQLTWDMEELKLLTLPGLDLGNNIFK
jgi:hypothetical protein